MTGWSRARRTSFQPICGTRLVSGNRRTSPWSHPRPSTRPSSLRSNSTWRPMQMPRNGTRSSRTRARMGSTSPESLSDSSVALAAPTPGQDQVVDVRERARVGDEAGVEPESRRART